ncbi:MAG TPA: glycosyltransferase, partial [Methylomirabilota bacterium]|nr:glycosyltransferase [Methylomirabilota bacterium]
LLIPRRTERELGCWCEEYGLYGEEDADYAERVRLSGKLLAYMEDENVGLHLPAGKAAAIDENTFVAMDGVEEKEHREYREWKDRLRRENARSGGAYHRNVRAYAQKTKPLRCESEFVRQYRSRLATPHGKPADGRPAPTDAVAEPATAAPPTPDLVSIVIPVCNRLDMTRPCLEAIRRETPAGAYEVIVVDNGSADGTREFLAQEAAAGRLRTIRNEANLGFARAVNQGIRAARGGFVLLLNNDTVPLPGWLEALLAEARTDSRIGLVGSLLLYPGGELIQHAGVTIGAGQGLLHPYHRHRLRRLDRVPAARESRDCQAVTGACLLVRREVIERVGVLDEEYVNGFEDVDFCFRALTAGWRIRYCAASRVIHHESMTPGRKTHEQANYRRLNTVWKGRIQPDETPEQTTMGIQDVLCREKLVAEPGHVRAMEMLARFCLQRGDRQEAAEWQDKLKQARASLPEPAGRPGDAPPAATVPTAAEAARREADAPPSRPMEAGTASPQERPLVSIVIPTFNNLPLTRQCLGSLYRNAAGPTHEIIVVDNASTDGSVEWLKAEHAAARLRAVFNSRNVGFARACNQGALEARGRFVLFLNNDTEVTPGWLESLVKTAAEPGVGVVGARLLYPDGKIQHAGVEFINGVPDHPFRRAAAEAPAVCQRRDLDMVTGACLLMPRELFVALAGFDEVYQNGVEDVDLCLRVRMGGYRVVYEPGCVVTHHEGQSKGRFDHVSENLRRFFARWKDRLDEKHRLVATTPRLIPSERSLLTETVSVAWEGSFLDLGSLSHVNRELTRALMRHPRVRLTCVGRNLIPREVAGLSEIQAAARQLRAQSDKDTQVTVRHAWPPDWRKPRHGEWVLLQPWEFGALPADWVRGLEQVREAWVPSEFVRRCYIESGVDPGKVHVVPNGIDPERFRPDVPPRRLATEKKFKFLFVGGTIPRKGPDVLLRAYLESFTADDDVCLVIKDFGG